jgi:hypothetical protein
MHPDQDTLKAMMQDAGFESVDYYNLTGYRCAASRLQVLTGGSHAFQTTGYRWH